MHNDDRKFVTKVKDYILYNGVITTDESFDFTILIFFASTIKRKLVFFAGATHPRLFIEIAPMGIIGIQYTYFQAIVCVSCQNIKPYTQYGFRSKYSIASSLQLIRI